MKKMKLNGKLSLNKETIARLNDDQMNDVKGGLAGTRVLCFASKAANCSDGSCGGLDKTTKGVVIACLNF